MGAFKLAFASFRKKKSSGIVFLVMCAIATFVLATALSLQIGTDGFYQKKVDELNTPHFTAWINQTDFVQEHFDFARDYEHTVDIDTVGALFNIGVWNMRGGVERETSVILFPEQSLRETFYSPPVVDRQATRTADSIVLPLAFRSAGFRSGQQITMSVNNVLHTFTIYGFYEDAIAGGSTFGMDLAFIDNSNFDTLLTAGNFIPFTSIMLRFESGNMARGFGFAFFREFNLDPNTTFAAAFEDSEMAATTFVSMMSMIMMVFAVIVLVIAFIVVMFSIRSSINEEIKSIGVLKAVGYSDAKLRSAQIIKYLCLAALGAVIGSIGALLFFPVIGNIIASTSGLLWLEGTNFLPSILAILVIGALTALLSWVFTMRYKKITPVSALRSSNQAKTRGGNILPITSTAMPLDVHMGTKRFIASIASNINLFVVISLLVFVSLLVNVLNYNMNIDRTAMIQMVGMEMSEVYAQTLDSSVDMVALNDQILLDARVDRTILVSQRLAFVGEEQIFIEIMADFNQLSMSTIVSGRNPTAAGEITLSVSNSRALNKRVGSTLDIEINGHTETYRVVGITQAIASTSSRITEDSIIRHEPDYAPGIIFIYLRPGTDTNAFINDWRTNAVPMINTEEQMDTILSSMGGPIQMLTGIMMVLNVLIVAFVLYLMISTIIRKTKQEFGILKALGFTNGRLIIQLLLSLLPALLLGTITGIILGFVLTNPILSVFFGSVGLLRAMFIIPPLASFIIAFSIFGTSIVATYVISLKLRSISPQKLITES